MAYFNVHDFLLIAGMLNKYDDKQYFVYISILKSKDQLIACLWHISTSALWSTSQLHSIMILQGLGCLFFKPCPALLRKLYQIKHLYLDYAGSNLSPRYCH